MVPSLQSEFAVKALIVEDSIVNQKVLAGLLQQQGIESKVVGNGQQAVETIAREEFDIVFMDIQMPVMDGLCATKLIRSNERDMDRHLFIVAVTAGMDRESCMEAGVDDFHEKPLKAGDFFNKLEEWLESIH